VKRPAFPLSKLFEEYEAMTKDEVKDFSPNQLRVWRNSRMRAVENFVSVVDDKPVNEVTVDDAIDYTDWWRDRVISDDVAVKSANKDIGQLSRMLKDVSIRRRFNIPEIFKGLRLRGQTERSRMPFETEFIQNELLATGALAAYARITRGAISLSSSTHFPPMVVSKFVKPVVLPPGRARLATKPRSTGSLTPVKTIGIVRVACCRQCRATIGQNHVRRQAEDLRNCGAGLFRVVHAQPVFDREITPNCPPSFSRLSKRCQRIKHQIKHGPPMIRAVVGVQLGHVIEHRELLLLAAPLIPHPRIRL
jgi:hypothetical protein